jgi:hypothetical protein
VQEACKRRARGEQEPCKRRVRGVQEACKRSVRGVQGDLTEEEQVSGVILSVILSSHYHLPLFIAQHLQRRVRGV